MKPASRDTLPEADETLDPDDWNKLRAEGHRMLDDMFDHIAEVRDAPGMAADTGGNARPFPRRAAARGRRCRRHLSGVCRVHRAVHRRECPSRIHGMGQRRRHGCRDAGRDAGGGAECQCRRPRSVADRSRAPDRLWVRQMFGFPDTASGIFVTGTSMANLMGILVARSARLGPSVRQRGLSDRGAGLIAYTSVATHGCIAQAMDLAGFGTDAPAADSG